MILAMILALGLLAGGPQAAPAAAPAGAEQAVQSAEAARVAALVGNDFTALDRILGDDLTYTHSSGQTDGKPQFIEALKAGRTKYVSLDTLHSQVRVYGKTAVMTGRMDVRILTNGQPVPLIPLKFTSVWVQRNGQWQFVAWQSTRVPAGE
jgi:ketosteroid isomerase-like protein